MSVPEKDYHFVGGSMDGYVMRMSGTPMPGMEYPGNLPLVNGRREIYVLDRDHKFCFNRYGLEVNVRAVTPEAMEKIQPILDKLSAPLRELDSVLEEFGGPGAESHIVGNWRIRHKDA